MPIDFTEFGSDGSELLESMTKEILERKGLKEVERTGKGPDQGKDVVFKEILDGSLSSYEKDWIVDCKFVSNPKRSVSPRDIGSQSIRQIMDRNGANAYLLVTNSRPSTNLYKDIEKVRDQKGYFATYWDKAQLEKELIHYPDVLKRFLPNSYKSRFGMPRKRTVFLSEFDCIEGKFSKYARNVNGWFAYRDDLEEGQVILSGEKSRNLLIRTNSNREFAVQAPTIINPRKLMANIFRCEFLTDRQLTVHLRILAEDRRLYYLTYETSDGNPERKSDSFNMLYAKYHLGKCLNNSRWSAIEKNLDDDLEYLFRTKVFFIEAVLFNVSGESKFKNVFFSSE